MAVNMKLGVDMGSFNSGINQAKAQLRTFDAALKNAESAFKATGDAESALATKMTALNGKFQTQKKMVEDYRKALKEMAKNGGNETDAAFQKLQKDMLLAEAAMYDTQAAIDALSGSEEKAADSADKLSNSVNNIGKKMSLDQVIGGIDKITGGLEKAAGVAIRLGEQVFDNIMTSAQWGDDIATQAMMAQMSVEDYQRVVNVAATQGETSVSSLIKSWKRLKTNMAGDSKEVAEALDELGVSMYENVGGKYGNAGPLRDYMDIYWEIGEALMAMGESADQERYAQTLLGRSWQESIPMFRMGREEYEKALKAQDVVSEEGVNNLATLNDTVIGLEQQFNTLKNQVLAEFAPTLTEVGGVVSGLLSELNEYLKTDDGKQMLTDLGTAVSGLFEDLKDIDPEDVVNNFVKVFDKLVKAFEFVSNNWPDIVDGIKAIGIAFGALKIGEGVLEGLRLINGFKNLTGAGGGDPTQTTGTKTGGLNSKIMSGIGAMVVVNWDPSRAREIEKETGRKRDALAKYLDELNGSNLYELQQEWENNKTNNGGGNFLQQVMDSPKNLAKVIWDALTNKGTAGDWSSADGDDWSVKVKPEAEEGSAEALAEQIGAVTVPVNLEIAGFGGSAVGGGGGSGLDPLRQAMFGGMGFANGLSYVPRDGIYLLHKGEGVGPAREMNSRNFSSNLYVEKMIMNNGTDAQGLANKMAAEQQRTMSGYGS